MCRLCEMLKLSIMEECMLYNQTWHIFFLRGVFIVVWFYILSVQIHMGGCGAIRARQGACETCAWG